jgi:hypothetical protein
MGDNLRWCRVLTTSRIHFVRTDKPQAVMGAIPDAAAAAGCDVAACRKVREQRVRLKLLRLTHSMKRVPLGGRANATSAMMTCFLRRAGVT